MSLPSARIPRQLARLNAIARGPGAIKLPANVKAINLSFKFQNKDGHMGPRKFWQKNLPQVQFHNPATPISVSRKFAVTPEEAGKVPAVLSITFADGSEKSVNVKHKHSDEILEDLIRLTEATPVPIEEQPLLTRQSADVY
ncbi:hypothetical protein DV451_000886 [Geotrichum candidum]|uniref:Ribosomal protein/NADH dehydrogenase domain-containing protein n=1 Tax=Geotrichum candidum TaxID=1173061 RepID=A0A9P5G943_GEOCN|nr:hypothetical protein DV451_000886 [Geotrichum candidum]